MQTTCVIIKPDAVRRELSGKIISRIEYQGWHITKMEMLRLTTAQVCTLYRQHSDQPWFNAQITFMRSGHCIVMEVYGMDAINGIRRLVGSTDRSPGTIRGDWSNHVRENLVHCSDSPEAAKRELELFF